MATIAMFLVLKYRMQDNSREERRRSLQLIATTSALEFYDLSCALLLVPTKPTAVFPGMFIHPVNSATQPDKKVFPRLDLNRRGQEQAVLQQIPSVFHSIKIWRTLRVLGQGFEACGLLCLQNAWLSQEALEVFD